MVSHGPSTTANKKPESFWLLGPRCWQLNPSVAEMYGKLPLLSKEMVAIKGATLLALHARERRAQPRDVLVQTLGIDSSERHALAGDHQKVREEPPDEPPSPLQPVLQLLPERRLGVLHRADGPRVAQVGRRAHRAWREAERVF